MNSEVWPPYTIFGHELESVEVEHLAERLSKTPRKWRLKICVISFLRQTPAILCWTRYSPISRLFAVKIKKSRKLVSSRHRSLQDTLNPEHFISSRSYRLPWCHVPRTTYIMQGSTSIPGLGIVMRARHVSRRPVDEASSSHSSADNPCLRQPLGK